MCFYIEFFFQVNTTIIIYPKSQPTTPPPALHTHLFDRDVRILKYAAPFARVSQPDPQRFPNAEYHKTKFKIKYDSSGDATGKAGAFNVTAVGGIVYVQDVSVLRKSKPEVV